MPLSETYEPPYVGCYAVHGEIAIAFDCMSAIIQSPNGQPGQRLRCRVTWRRTFNFTAFMKEEFLNYRQGRNISLARTTLAMLAVCFGNGLAQAQNSPPKV